MRRLVPLIAILIAVGAQAATEREKLWHEDLQYLASGLKAPGFRIAGGIATRGQKDFATLYPDFDARIAALDADVASLTDAEVLLRLMQLMASAHVAHNTIVTRGAMGFRNRLPMTLNWFADGMAVTATTPEYAAAAGTRVLNIGGIDTDTLLTALTPYVSYENDSERRRQAANLMTAQGVLERFKLLGDDGRVQLRLQKPAGQTLDLPVPFTAADVKMVPLVGGPAPAYYRHEYLADSKTLYIQYNVCANDPKLPFKDFARQVLADADAHEVSRAIIDLRNNGGGNSAVIGPLKSGLAARRKTTGPLYLLIGPGTFSSAVNNAMDLRASLAAILVGEPSGGMPGGYGEVATLTLPNSKLVVRYTTKHFGSAAGNTGPAALVPDIAAPLTVADFVAGTDPALAAAIRGH